MIGILTEKPSAGRNFAKALGGPKGTYQGEEYIIVSARGHLYEFVNPEQQVPAALASKYKAWNVENLPWNETDFSWKRAKKKDTSAVLKTIKDTLSKCSEICIATDVDPTGEGELLAWEILDELRLRPSKWSRMFFTDEAPNSIQNAFTSRKPIVSMQSDMDYVKAYYRARYDFLTMQFTRIATRFGDGRSVLRQGRLKSAMVLITGDGLKAVSEYKKIPYYQNRFRDNNGVMFTNPDEPSFPDKGSVPSTYTESAVIVDERTMKRTAPPKLLDLASLSSMLSGKGIKAKTVLATYQKMYEAQVVSYPRTEDKVITPEQFAELLPKVDAIARLVGVDSACLTHRVPRKTHVKTGGAHGANRPGPNVPASLSDLKKYGPGAEDIYRILARNYLAMLAEDYEYERQTGHLEKYPAFKGVSNVPKVLGYKVVFSDADEADEDESAKGLGNIAKPFIHEGFPKKPPTPTMKWLMKQLEKHDVGTGATRTSIYADVTNDNTKYPLLVEKRGKLSMSEYGEMSYRLLPNTHIGDLRMTESLSEDMRNIAAGKANPEQLLQKMRQMVMDDIAVMEKNGESMRKDLGIAMSTMQTKEKYKGTFNGKEISFNREFSGHMFTDEECEALLRGESITCTDFISKKNGKSYGATGSLAKQDFNGHKYYGFKIDEFVNNGGSGSKSNDIPNEWCKHKFTDEEKQILKDGGVIDLEGCMGKSGKLFRCQMRYGEQKTHNNRIGLIPSFSEDWE